MNRFRKYVPAVVAGVGAVVVAASPGFCLDLTGVTVDIADYETIATLLIGALVLIWPIKRAMGMLFK